MRCVVLDAMGVIFRAADDVADLLIPFVRAYGGALDAEAIQSTYIDASLGVISADEFWIGVGLDPSVEDEYLSKHALVPGVRDFLVMARDKDIPVWCLSNDVGRWSRKLRTSFEIDSSSSAPPDPPAGQRESPVTTAGWRTSPPEPRRWSARR